MNPALLRQPATASSPIAGRALRAVLAAVLLGGGAACTPKADNAPAASRAAVPFATLPAPDESIAAKSKPVLTEPAARDDVLAQALVGRWGERATAADGTALDSTVTFAADGGLSAVFRNSRDGSAAGSAAGTWAIRRGFLIYTVTAPVAKPPVTAEILRIDAGTFAYVDPDDKQTRIATRLSGSAPAAATAQATQATSPVPPVPAAPPAAEGTLFADETLYIAEEDTQAYVLRLDEAAQIRLNVEIAERVPLNIVFQRGRVSPENYAMGLGVLALGQVLSVFDENKERKVATPDDLFAGPLSKRAAYRRFASPWVSVGAGTYSVILDNSGELSPSRGDAPVRLRLYRRPLP